MQITTPQLPKDYKLLFIMMGYGKTGRTYLIDAIMNGCVVYDESQV